MLIFWVLRKSTNHSTAAIAAISISKKNKKQKTKKQVPQEQLEGCFFVCLSCLFTFSLSRAHAWVIFFKKATKAFRYPALLTLDGWFHIFSSKGLRKSEVTSILLIEARICLYKLSLCMYGHAPLLMGIYNNYRYI